MTPMAELPAVGRVTQIAECRAWRSASWRSGC